MERLTKISEIGNAYYPKCFEEPCCGMGECLDDNCSLMIDACKKLAEYEQLEEQGLLVRLPCKVGDDLYCIVNGEVKKLKVHSFGVPDFEIIDIEFKYVDGFKIVRFVGEVGKTVFLTREEAEKKLEEIQNDKT
jgi:hypothetical protein|nr:MAG TPA: hypothetical protein [Caudoviricetes sp.]